MRITDSFSSIPVICLNTNKTEYINALDSNVESRVISDLCNPFNWDSLITIPGMENSCRITMNPYGPNFIVDFFEFSSNLPFARIAIAISQNSARDIWCAPHCFGGILGEILSSPKDVHSAPFVLWAINEEQSTKWGEGWFLQFVRDLPTYWLQYISVNHPEKFKSKPDFRQQRICY